MVSISRIVGATGNNLRDVTVDIPLGVMTCVTGVSGSGKSTLINDTLYRKAAELINNSSQASAPCREIRGLEHVDAIIDISQAPIGRTPRSNPATYAGLFTPVRELFAGTQEARSRGYKAGRFSFNVKGGRCEACQGDGMIKVEMHFLPDVYVPCDVCKGKRYNRETLEIKYKGRNIHEVLDLTIEDALDVFRNVPAVARKLQTLMDVGLGYVRLGQSATTLSGGEAQRVKLAKELSKRATGNTLYILDEPTTGLHFHDIAQLLTVLQALRDQGNTVVVIEHNLDVIKTADWIIDLGPEGGDGGGTIVATGTPEEVAANPDSHTGRYLAPLAQQGQQKETRAGLLAPCNRHQPQQAAPAAERGQRKRCSAGYLAGPPAFPASPAPVSSRMPATKDCQASGAIPTARRTRPDHIDRVAPGPLGAGQQHRLDKARVGDKLFILLPWAAQVRVEQLEQLLLGIAPAKPVLQLTPVSSRFIGAGERGIYIEQCAIVRILGLTRLQRIGFDFHDQFAQFFGRRKQRNRIVVALAHLASVEAGQNRGLCIDHGLRQYKSLAVDMIETLGDIPGHFHMLNLVLADRHLVRAEHQDVGGHQHRVTEQGHRHALVGIARAAVLVILHRGLVCVGPIHQALRRHAADNPGEFGYLGNIGLTIKHRLVGIEPECEPGSRHLERRLPQQCGILVFDQRMVIGKEIERIGICRMACRDSRTDGTCVIAEMRCAGCRYTGEDGLLRHTNILPGHWPENSKSI